MHEHLSPNWVGILVGLAGLIVGIFGIAMTVRSKKRSHMTTISEDISLRGGDAEYPDGIEVRYRGVPVPKVTASIVWIWNSGNTTVRETDIVLDDPLGFQFLGNVLNISVRKVTRDVIGISAFISPKPDTVHLTFEFLDPGDRAILEVLHDGDAESPKCLGTIIGLPNGLDCRSVGHRPRWKVKSDVGTFMLAGIFTTLGCLFMLVMSAMEIFGVVSLEKPPSVGAVVLVFILGVGATLFAVSGWQYKRGLSVPSALDY